MKDNLSLEDSNVRQWIVKLESYTISQLKEDTLILKQKKLGRPENVPASVLKAINNAINIRQMSVRPLCEALDHITKDKMYLDTLLEKALKAGTSVVKQSDIPRQLTIRDDDALFDSLIIRLDDHDIPGNSSPEPQQKCSCFGMPQRLISFFFSNATNVNNLNEGQQPPSLR